MTFRRGQSGNPKGRPPRAAEMRAALKANADQIAKLLPAVRMTAHDLLRSLYTDERVPLPIRLQAATAALPTENYGLAAAELLNRMRQEQLTGSRKAAAPGRNGADHRHRHAAPPINGHHHAAPPAEAIDLDELLGG